MKYVTLTIRSDSVDMYDIKYIPRNPDKCLMPAEVMKDLELWWLREMHHRIEVRCNRHGVITMNFDGEEVMVNVWYKVGEILPRKVAYGKLPYVEVGDIVMN